MNENDKPAPYQETKSERLEREIAEFEKQLKFFEEVERSAKNDQHWLKKRLKLAKEELSELKESSVETARKIEKE